MRRRGAVRELVAAARGEMGFLYADFHISREVCWRGGIYKRILLFLASFKRSRREEVRGSSLLLALCVCVFW